LTLLEEVGLEVHNEKAIRIFKENGCVIHENENRVTFPEEIVDNYMALVPPTFTLYGRDPRYDFTLPDDGPIFGTASSGTNVRDPLTGEVRPSTAADIARIGHLINELPGISMYTCTISATDASYEYRNLERFYPALKNCLKPVRASGVDCVEEAEKILKLGYFVAGSKEEFLKRPFIAFHNCPVIAPLKMDHNSTEMLIYFVERGIPTYATIVPNAGLTSPLSLGATLVQHVAEFLAVTVLMQMVRPNTPVMFNSLPTVADMRTGAYAPGGIECGLLHMACAQMARFFNVPCGGYIGQTNSKLPDAQAGYERALAAAGGMMAGMDMLQIGGLIEALMTFDYAQLAIDNEIALMLKRVARGIEYDEEEIGEALKETKEVGPGGVFMETPLTLRNLRSLQYIPTIADRRPRSAWEAEGSKDASEKALDLVKEILSRDNPNTISEEADRKIRAEFPLLMPGISGL
ncbi:MAG: trimethylamine methyltransferase family protein, partial [Clostridia bacterium]